MGIFVARLISRDPLICRRKTVQGNSSIQHKRRPSVTFGLSIVVSVVVSLLLVSCDNDPQVPQGSQVVLYPGSKSISITEYRDATGRCLFTPDYFQDVPIQITLLNHQSQPISGATLGLFLDYSGNSFSGRSVMSLFNDVNGNGVIDVGDDLVSGPGDSWFELSTTAYTGSAHVMVRVNLSCAFRGSLTVFAGPAAGSLEFSVQAESTITEGQPTVDPVTDPVVDTNTDTEGEGEPENDAGTRVWKSNESL